MPPDNDPFDDAFPSAFPDAFGGGDSQEESESSQSGIASQRYSMPRTGLTVSGQDRYEITRTGQ